MKALHLTLPLFASLALCPLLRAQNEAFTDPVGFNSVECLPNSDTYCGVPFVQNPAFQGILNAVPSVNGGQAVLVPSGTPGWAVNEFQNAFFVRLISGAKAGAFFQVTANDAGSLTVDLGGDTATVAGVAAGDGFRIFRFWTLATLFPPATQTTFVVSTGTLPNQRRSRLLLPDLAGAGTNLAPVAEFFILSGQWRKSVSGFPVADNEMLWPDAYFIVRHNHATITASTFFTPTGLVETNAVTLPLSTRTVGPQDNFVLSGRPVPIKLKDLDLISSGAFIASTGVLPNQRRDLLLVFDNASAQINKAPSAAYFYLSGNWRKAVSGNPIADDDELKPSEGIIIRKYQTAGGSSAYWTHTY